MKPSRDYDQGARDGNQDLPPAKPDNPEYMEGYEEGLGLADAGVPYFPFYREDDTNGKRSHPDYEQISAYIRKETHRAVKLALLEDGGEDFSDLVEKQLQQWLKRRAKNRTTGLNDG